MKENIEKLNSYLAIDPFSGKPYMYIIKKQTVLIYSYGENLKDDECKISPDNKYYIDDIVVKCKFSISTYFAFIGSFMICF